MGNVAAFMSMLGAVGHRPKSGSLPSGLTVGKKRARIAVVLKGGKVSQVLAAETDAEVVVVDFDEINNIPDTAITPKTLNTILTFDVVERNDAAMGELHDDVVGLFVDRGLGHALNS